MAVLTLICHKIAALCNPRFSSSLFFDPLGSVASLWRVFFPFNPHSPDKVAILSAFASDSGLKFRSLRGIE
jgi:hypothetical protein